MTAQRMAMLAGCVLLATILGVAILWTGSVENPIPTPGNPSQASDVHTNAEPSPASTATPYLYLAVVFLALGTTIAVATTFYLYRWRRILLANPHMLLPEELGGYLSMIDKRLDQLSGWVARSDGASEKRFSAIQQDSSSIGKTMRDFQQAFVSLQAELDLKDGEIKRLKNGYDAQVFKRFLLRFIKVDQALHDVLLDGASDGADLKRIQSILHDAFEECDLERFSPPDGIEYRSATGVAENPEIVSSGHGMKAGQVIRTLDPGYRLRHGESFEIIVPARVAVAG